jgi:hypothetical protein
MSTTTTNTTTTSVSSHDPNSLTGPAGYGSQGFIGANEVLPYRIDFENDPTATAPAQAVTITDPLSTDLDWSTFQLTGIGWGDFNLTIPAGSQTYETTVPMTYNGTTFDVQVQAGIHAGTGQVYATFQSIDPATSLPPSVLIGLLPPEDGTGRGQGYITYLVSTKTGLATGTSFNNVAVISFDQQTTIATDQTNDTDPTVDPTKEATLTIDAAPPTSSVDALPAMTLTPTFTVSWSGQDDAGGSGIASYDIYVSIDGGAFQPWLTATTATSAAYPGTIGHSYGFYSVARDNAGNVEALPSTAQAQISVPAPNRFVTFGGKVKGQYTDANGHIVTFILSGPGSGTLGFVGSDPSDPVEIILTGTTARSSLTVEIAKGAVTTLTDVQISGSLNIFNASTSDLEGSFEVGGTLRSLTLKDVISGGATISVGGSAVATVYHFGSIDGLSLTSASAIRLLTATTWFDSGSSTDSLTAHSVLAMQIKGNFDPILNLTGALGSLAVNGSIVAGTWIIAGHIGAVKVGSIANGWSATVAGSVGPFIVKGTDNGSVTAASIASMQIGGSSTDAAITVTGSNQGRKASLGSLVVDGSLTDSQVRTFGGIGAITLGGMSGSDIFAGISSSTTTLPTALAEFVEPSSILSFTVKGKSPFADSIVAASMIGTMNLADVNTNNNGSSFGVATESLGSFSLRQPKQKAFIWNNKQSASLLTSLPGDLKVEEV